jgi:hypothetical protein
MAQLSKTQLFNDLAAIAMGESCPLPELVDVDVRGLKHHKITNETYGRKSCIYITVPNLDKRKRLEQKLINLGYVINQNYWPGNPVLEVTVRYFKGWHWQE